MHPCEVRAVRPEAIERAIEFESLGHDVHICKLERPAFAAHTGDHECSCGLVFGRTPLDDEPLTALAARTGVAVERLEFPDQFKGRS